MTHVFKRGKDSPHHESFMATFLAGAVIRKGSIVTMGKVRFKIKSIRNVEVLSNGSVRIMGKGLRVSEENKGSGS
jgi:hypothetical protein